MGASVHVSSEKRDAAVLVRVAETHILADRAEAFRERLLACMPAEGGRMAIDLGKVDFLDSSGIGALVSVLKAVRPQGDVVLFGLRPSVREIFRLTHLDAVLPCEDDEAAALAALSARAGSD